MASTEQVSFTFSTRCQDHSVTMEMAQVVGNLKQLKRQVDGEDKRQKPKDGHFSCNVGTTVFKEKGSSSYHME
ncbi:hypothetical protein Scep_026462 [Stephania cephalantha]|uniref:Uncharacterized protein n=1 Tax=Stephania cephalantha TaxID=152367 RepID=A0AAP0HN71_9MAGN